MFGLIQVDEGVEVAHAFVAQPSDILVDHLWIVGNNGTGIIVIGISKCLALVLHTGKEYCLDAAIKQPFNVAMRQLCRIADILRRNRVHPHLEYLVAGACRHCHPETQLGENGEP